MGRGTHRMKTSESAKADETQTGDLCCGKARNVLGFNENQSFSTKPKTRYLFNGNSSFSTRLPSPFREVTSSAVMQLQYERGSEDDRRYYKQA